MDSAIVGALIGVAVVLVFYALKNLVGGGIDSQTARQLVRDGATLVDVRTPNEFAGGHVDGAVNIPVDEIAGRADELDKEKPVVLYCRSGARSSRATSTLKAKGFDAHNLGPMSAW